MATKRKANIADAIRYFEYRTDRVLGLLLSENWDSFAFKSPAGTFVIATWEVNPDGTYYSAGCTLAVIPDKKDAIAFYELKEKQLKK